MRVLTFLHSFEPGGVERIALRLVRQWRALGIDAPLFLGRRNGAMAGDVGLGLEMMSPRPLAVSSARWETIWMILTLPRAILREQPDILFCAGNTYGVVALSMKLLLGRRCPPIVAKVSNDLDRRDKPWWKRVLYRIWLRLLGRHLDQLVGMAEPMRSEIRERFVVSGDRIAIVPDPALSREMIDLMRRPRRVGGTERCGRRFIAVGRLVPQKNIALMLRAFARGGASDDHLTVVGDGPERQKLVVLADRLGLAGRVDFPGYLPSPPAILPDFDVLLLSSDYEGVPAVILEALAANLAIVATDCSRSMATLLREERLGELVPVGDERAFADAIARARPGSADAQLSLEQAERFTLEHAADLYISVMARVRRPHSGSNLGHSLGAPLTGGIAGHRS